MITSMARPLDYKEESFLETVNEYFNNLPEGKMPTKAGLLKTLKISRQTWANYKKRDEFIDTIRDAEFDIEEAWNQKLVGTGATGPLFYLKNAFKEEYRESQDITSGGKPIAIYGGISKHNSDEKSLPTEKED